MKISFIFELSPTEIWYFLIFIITLRPPPPLFDELLDQLAIISSPNWVNKAVSGIILGFP